nr:hypothetical protein [Tanacetum cinerariifolium]
MFKEQAKQELFEMVKAFHACKQEDGQPISPYLLKIKGYLETLERLGYLMPKELGVILILNSLSKDYMIREVRSKKIRRNCKRQREKTKFAYTPKPKIPPPPKRDNPAKDLIFHHCNEVGYGRRNYLAYHAELTKRKNASVASTLCIFTIEL